MKRFKWRYLLLVPVAILAFVLLDRAHREARYRSGPLGQRKRAAGDVRYTKLTPADERNKGGIYDPSLAYTPDGSVGWLAYSSLHGDLKPIGPYVSTHLARSTDHGASWQFVKPLNISADATLATADGKSLAGAWRYEVPSLVFDPTDPDSTRRWKLYSHRYFSRPSHDRMVQYGWIALRTSADPAGEWSEELPLFGAGKNPLPPHHRTAVDLNALDASLKNVVAYSEPGRAAHDGQLYMSLTAVSPRLGLSGISIRHAIVLLGSDDHGTRWRLVRRLLDNDIASRFGVDLFDGSSLVEEDGRIFLLAAPGHRGAEHDGTVAFEFESLAQGRLRRDTHRLPVVAAYFAPQPRLFSGPGAGQATYDPRNERGGLLMSQFDVKAYPEVFQIFQTGLRITPVD